MERGMETNTLREPNPTEQRRARLISENCSITSPSRPKTLKRTISKCGIDAGFFMDQGDRIAPKKLAPLQEPLALSSPPPPPYQPSAITMAPSTYFDDGEPVLLPRFGVHSGDDVLDEFDENSLNDGGELDVEDEDRQPEYSPGLFYDDSPVAMKNRYYETILESSVASALVSPSPQHVLYPYTPTSDSASTVSIGSSMSSGYGSIYGIPTHVLAAQQRAAMQDREYLSAANLHAIVLEYIQEMFTYYQRARNFTFGQVGQMVQSVPFAFRYIQSLVKDRLGISWHLVGNFVENVLDFICDEDIRDATVYEFASFLRSIQDKLYESMPPGNIFVNLYEFFQNVLGRFKKYLIQSWLATKRIEFPCEFGKKSTSLFLCMECHREHL